MSNPVDILVRVLGGDAAAGKLSGVGNALGGIVGKATALVASLASVAAITHAINTADEMGKFAQKVGVAVDKLSQFTYAAKASNVEAGELRAGLRSLADWMVKTGQSGKSVTDVLLEQADAFDKLPDGAEKSAIAMDRFGRAGEAFIPFLNQGRQGITQLIQESDRLGATISGRFSADAAEFNDHLGRIKTGFAGIASKIAEAALPELNKFAKAMESFVQSPLTKSVVEGGANFITRVIGNTIPMLKALVTWQYEAWKAFGEGLMGGKGFVESFRDAIGAVEKVWTEFSDRMAETELGLMGKNPDGSERTETGSGPPRQPGRDFAGEQAQLRDQVGSIANSIARQETIGFKRREERVRDVTKEYRHQKEVLDELNASIIAQIHSEGVTESQRLEMRQRHLDVLNQTLAVEQKLQQLASENTFTGRMLSNIQELADRWSNFGANAADLLTGTLNTGIEAFAAHIGNAVMGAESLGEAFSNIGKVIVQEVVTGIIRMFAQMIVSRLLYSAVDKAASTGEAASKAPGALLTSISSYGTAAVVGTLALLAGLAAIGGAFEKGGIVRGGRQLIQVNESGEEAVINSRGLNNLGADLVNGINAGLVTAADFRPAASSASGSGSGGGSGIQNDNRVNVMFLQSEEHLADQLRRTSSRSVILDIARRSVHQIPGRSA